MARVLSTATVLGLLAASAVAFAITEGAKLTRSPIYATKITNKVFSPKAAVPETRFFGVSFRLRTTERVSVWMEDAHGSNVRTLLPPRSVHHGTRLSLEWDGLSDGGLIEPDGVYRPVVKLENSHRTIVLPNSIRIDTKVPAIIVPHPLHTVISPDGDHHRDVFRVTYRVTKPAHGLLFVRVGRRTTQVELTRFERLVGTLEWNGQVKVNGVEKTVRPGAYLLSVAARDLAGNQSTLKPFAVVTVRFVALGRRRVVVQAGRRFAIRVSADAPTVQWMLHGRRGVARPGTLHLTAPKTKGVYALYVTVGSHSARATVVVG